MILSQHRISRRLLPLFFWALTTVAAAQETAEYDAFVRQAVVEVEQGNWEEARALFRRAHQLSPNARTWRGLGISAFETRQYVEAVAELEAALADPRKALTPEQRDEVKALLERAREFISVFRVQVTPEDAEVLVDGDKVELKDDTLFLDPGPHTVVVRAPGYQERQAHVRANAGQQDELSIELHTVSSAPGLAEALAPSRPAPAPEDAAKPEVSAKRRRLATWILAGAAVATGGAGLGLGLATRSKHDAFDACRGGEMRDDCRALADDGKRLQLLTNLSLGLAGGLAAGSVVAFFLEGRVKEEKRTHVTRIVPTLRGLSVRGSF